MPRAAADKLGPYEILALIGAGGMGQVWKAADTRLNRSVAIKICSADFTGRFELEPRAVAALNHPNICTLHDVGPDYLVMELVEGPTVAERLAAVPPARRSAGHQLAGPSEKMTSCIGRHQKARHDPKDAPLCAVNQKKENL